MPLSWVGARCGREVSSLLKGLPSVRCCLWRVGGLGGGGAAGRAEPCLYSPCCIGIQAGVAGQRVAQRQEEVCALGLPLGVRVGWAGQVSGLSPQAMRTLATPPGPLCATCWPCKGLWIYV